MIETPPAPPTGNFFRNTNPTGYIPDAEIQELPCDPMLCGLSIHYQDGIIFLRHDRDRRVNMVEIPWDHLNDTDHDTWADMKSWIATVHREESA